MGWLGLDDTDGLDGGCTTHAMNQIIAILSSESESRGWSICNPPQLIRLWPFASRRTRGNAAVAVEIKCSTKKINEDLISRLNELWESLILESVKKYGGLSTSSHNERPQYAASPAMIWTDTRPNEEWYWRCVRSEVSLDDCMELIPLGATIWHSNLGHGRIGALAAIAWLGEVDQTWEAIAYREVRNIGKERQISQSMCAQLDSKFPETFLNRDPTASRSIIAPRTPCPVLFGIRAESAHAAKEAAEWLTTGDDCEPISGIQVWRTNQATDDHIEKVMVTTLADSVDIRQQGHSSFTGIDEQKIVAFAQSGPINRTVQSLVEGDQIEYTGLQSPDGSIHLEKLRVIKIANNRLLRPLCDCGKRMKSMGDNQGVRCPACGTRTQVTRSNELSKPLGFDLGQWYEPSPAFRRHLAAPLSRINLDHPNT